MDQHERHLKQNVDSVIFEIVSKKAEELHFFQLSAESPYGHANRTKKIGLQTWDICIESKPYKTESPYVLNVFHKTQNDQHAHTEAEKHKSSGPVRSGYK